MGAIFFAGLLVVSSILAGTFFLIGSILLIISFIKKRKGKKVKGLRIVTIISYFISLVFIAVPIGWFGLLRMANQQTFDDYVNTGVYVSSTASEIYGGGQFYYKGDLYIQVDNELCGFKIEREQAVANAKSSSSVLLDKIFNYNNEATIYSVKNDSGYKILLCGSSIYYREVDKEKIINYYNSLAEYKYNYVEFGTNGGLEYINIEFNKEVFEQLRSKYESGETKVIITDDYAGDYSINQTSADGVYLRSVSVLLTDDSAYVISTSSGGTYTGYQLDKKTEDFVKVELGFHTK